MISAQQWIKYDICVAGDVLEALATLNKSYSFLHVESGNVGPQIFEAKIFHKWKTFMGGQEDRLDNFLVIAVRQIDDLLLLFISSL